MLTIVVKPQLFAECIIQIQIKQNQLNDFSLEHLKQYSNYQKHEYNYITLTQIA